MSKSPQNCLWMADSWIKAVKPAGNSAYKRTCRRGPANVRFENASQQLAFTAVNSCQSALLVQTDTSNSSHQAVRKTLVCWRIFPAKMATECQALTAVEFSAHPKECRQRYELLRIAARVKTVVCRCTAKTTELAKHRSNRFLHALKKWNVR